MILFLLMLVSAASWHSSHCTALWAEWLNVAEVKKLAADNMGPTEIAAKLNIGRASVYRALKGVQRATQHDSVTT